MEDTSPETGAPSVNMTRRALLDAALDIAARQGVRAITHRKVAAKAGVSLGSTNYYFASIDELVLEAFRHFSLRERSRYDEIFEAAQSLDAVTEAVLALVQKQFQDTDRAVLLYELYAQGVRDPRYAAVVRSWSRASLARLEERYSRAVAAQIEVFVEGFTFQRLLGDTSLSDRQARSLIRTILEGSGTNDA